MNVITRQVAFAAALLCLAIPFATPARGDDKDKPKIVTIKDLAYTPAKITIKAGESITWVNKDDNDHTVVSDSKDEPFDSDNLPSGEKFKHTFKKAGKFKYHCRYHPRMKGEVTVAD